MALERFHKLQFYRRNRDIWGLAASSESGGGGAEGGKTACYYYSNSCFQEVLREFHSQLKLGGLFITSSSRFIHPKERLDARERIETRHRRAAGCFIPTAGD